MRMLLMPGRSPTVLRQGGVCKQAVVFTESERAARWPIVVSTDAGDW